MLIIAESVENMYVGCRISQDYFILQSDRFATWMRLALGFSKRILEKVVLGQGGQKLYLMVFLEFLRFFEFLPYTLSLEFLVGI